jgi:monoamine oxidase
MGTNAKVLLQFSRRFQALDRWSGVLERDLPTLDTWASSDAQPGPSGLLTVYSGGKTGAGYPAAVAHGRPSNEVLDRTLGVIDEAVPGTAAGFNGRAWIDAWVHDPWARGSYAAFLPGQYSDFWGYTKQAEGRIHFAGEHTSTHSQGYLNGGVESGERAAHEVLRALAGR